jgi:DNA replication protein DnaC
MGDSRAGDSKMGDSRMEGSQALQAAAEVCPLCGGTGWKTVAGSNAGGSANDRRVTRCDCRLRARAKDLLSLAKIPKRYEHCELSNFDFDGPHIKLASARMIACRFVEEYPLAGTGLMFVGSSGLGKTHLAVGITKALVLNKGISCLFADYRELLKQIQNSYNPSVQMTELGILRPVFDAEVLVLDDLGAVKPTEWVWDAVSFILNARYNGKRTTIITTNFADEAEQETSANPNSETERAKRAAAKPTLGDRITERMRSRLHEMCRLVRMDGQDYRESLRNAGAQYARIEVDLAVACADCPRCGKENVYKRVGAIRKGVHSTLAAPITCKRCGEVFRVTKNELQIRTKARTELDAEYSVDALEWM